MHKPTETKINILVDKLNKTGIGVSSMQNNDVVVVYYNIGNMKIIKNGNLT